MPKLLSISYKLLFKFTGSIWLFTLNLVAEDVHAYPCQPNLFISFPNICVDSVAGNNDQIPINDWSKKPTWPKQLFREYDDRQCFQFSWLINYSPSSQVKINSQKSIGTKKTVVKDKHQPNSLSQKRDELWAFFPNHQGHGGITTEALKSITKQNTGESKPLNFSEQAINEVVQGNKRMDIDDNFFLSPELSVPCIHFNNEQFHDASSRLLDLKMRIISLLTISPRNGTEARYLLGAALHTIQDFYSHTNWIELGFTDIDRRLGREIIPNPPKDMYTSLPINKQESLQIYKQYQASHVATKIETLRQFDYEQKYDQDRNFRQLVYRIAAAKSDKAGTLLPEFINSKDKNLLTSGYFMGIGSIASCTVPFGKIRHGTSLFGCPQGLSKDETDTKQHLQVYHLALLASQDYINQILDSRQVSQDMKAIQTFMGIE